MKVRITLVLGLVMLAAALSACGSTHRATAQQKAEARAEATKFEAQAKKCLPTDGGVISVSSLKSHSGRQQFANCMVPPAQRSTFERCLQKAAFSGGFNRTKIEAAANTCVEGVK